MSAGHRLALALLLAGALGSGLVHGLAGASATDAGPLAPAEASPDVAPAPSKPVARTAGPVLRLAPAPPPTTRPSVPERLPPEARPPRTDHGFVVDEAGAPIARAHVRFRYRASDGTHRGRGSPQRGSLRTNAHGRFEIRAQATSMNEVVVWQRRFETFVGPWTPPGDGRPLEITLERLAVLEGSVTEVDGRPAGYLRIRLYPLGPDGEVGKRIEHRCMDSGRTWRFHVPAGRYLARVSGPTGVLAEQALVAARERPTRWDLTLPDGVFARGTLVLPPALRDREVELVLHIARPGTEALDAQDGDCDDERLEPGRRDFRLQVPPGDAPYWLVVHDPGLRRGLPPWVGGPYRGAREEWTVRVPEVAARRSTVGGPTWIVEASDEDEDPDAESALDRARRAIYTVELEDARGFTTWAHVYGGANAFLIEDVPAGAYTLRLTAYGGSVLQQRPLNVEGGEVIDLAPLVVR